jgi:predicted NBD/HSP70 family sugar kinase
MKKQPLNEEFLHMQKLAGLITEEEYKAHLWYDQYLKNISKALDNLKQTLNNEGYDVK